MKQKGIPAVLGAWNSFYFKNTISIKEEIYEYFKKNKELFPCLHSMS